jgi:hypothetical protein
MNTVVQFRRGPTLQQWIETAGPILVAATKRARTMEVQARATLQRGDLEGAAWVLQCAARTEQRAARQVAELRRVPR